jgi:UDPglucose 6-dehydrogenase
MKITIFGSGYVGLVTGACLAEVGHKVLCVDIDEQKIASLKNGEIPIYEPGLEELIHRNISKEHLSFSANLEEGVKHGLFQFIAVGTPPDEDGSADLQYVLSVARTIGQNMDNYKIIIDKSTVPVGTADKVRETLQNELNLRGSTLEFDVVSNPEFLKEGAAIDDFMRPDRIVIGAENPRTIELLKVLYAPFNRNHDRMIWMDVRSAEFTKYAANSMLATKISFMNEMANLAERCGADIEAVRKGIGSDPRIGYHFIYAGAGYGGSCFPKDIKALERTARNYGYQAKILQAVEMVNDAQKHVLFQKISRHYQGDLKGKTFALWGLSFKPKTDDMRDAPSRVLMEALWEVGATVQAFDPEAIKETQRIYGNRNDLILCKNMQETLQNADALVVVTEWKVFWSPDFSMLKKQLKEPIIFDGRNIYDPTVLKNEGFTYYGIGRGKV